MKKFLSVLLFVITLAVFVACQKSHDLAAPMQSDGEIATTTVEGTAMESTPFDCGQFRTQSQGGWGTTPSGNNPGAYLHAHFATAFPSGLRVGCDIGGIFYSSADAITAFIPSGGTPAVITGGIINDPSPFKNTLAGQVTALALSVGFDYADPDFAPAEENLGNLVMASGQFAGKSVNEMLGLAYNVLGGCDNTGGYSPSQMNTAISAINMNFLDGTINNGLLTCPSSRFER